MSKVDRDGVLLENIDTSTTLGKAEVMRLAAEGRSVVFIEYHKNSSWRTPVRCTWNWDSYDYGILALPDGPKELWVIAFPSGNVEVACGKNEAIALAGNAKLLGRSVSAMRYVRGDLVLEEKK